MTFFELWGKINGSHPQATLEAATLLDDRVIVVSLRCSSMSQSVERYGDDDDSAGDDFLDPIRIASLCATGGDHGHNQRPDEGAEDRTFPATETAASDDDRGDDV